MENFNQIKFKPELVKTQEITNPDSLQEPSFDFQGVPMQFFNQHIQAQNQPQSNQQIQQWQQQTQYYNQSQQQQNQQQQQNSQQQIYQQQQYQQQQLPQQPEIQQQNTNIPNNKQQFYEQGKNLMKQLQETINSTEWEQYINKKTVQGYKLKGCTTYLQTVKSIGEVSANAKFVLDTVFNINLRHELEEQFKEGKILEKINDDLMVVYQRNKGNLFAQSRDFIVLYYRECINGKYYFTFQSIEYPGVPLPKDVTRAVINLSGYCIEPVNDNKCKITTILNVDPKGDLPGFVKNKIYDMWGQKIDLLRKPLEKLYQGKK